MLHSPRCCRTTSSQRCSSGMQKWAIFRRRRLWRFLANNRDTLCAEESGRGVKRFAVRTRLVGRSYLQASHPLIHKPVCLLLPDTVYHSCGAVRRIVTLRLTLLTATVLPSAVHPRLTNGTGPDPTRYCLQVFLIYNSIEEDTLSAPRPVR